MRALVLILLLAACSGSTDPEPARYPTDGVWVGTATVHVYGDPIPPEDVPATFDLDNSRVQWDGEWLDLSWKVVTYDVGGAILVSWHPTWGCSGGGRLIGDRLVIDAHCDSANRTVDFTGTRTGTPA